MKWPPEGIAGFKTAQDAADKVADDLMGTCQSLHWVLERHDLEGADDIMEFCLALDDRVWECKVCGWWTEPSDVDENDVCSSCQGDEEEGTDCFCCDYGSCR